jgi:hypothetical protein
MDRQQISWLIVRTFGLYLLVQALMLVPDLLVQLYAVRAYNNFVSSMASQNDSLGSSMRQVSSIYRNLWVAPMLKFVLFSAVGIYLLRSGAFLIRLLARIPSTPTELNDEGNAEQLVGPERRERVSQEE